MRGGTPIVAMADLFAARVQEALAHPAPDVTGFLFVNLGAIRRNYRKLRDAAPGAETAGVIKANAYGLGVAQAMAALRAEGCKTFFVATPNEALLPPALTEGVTVYVLNGILTGGPEVFREGDIRPVLSSFGEIGEWLSICRGWGAPRPAAIHIDTGMTRLGLPADRGAAACAGVRRAGFAPRAQPSGLRRRARPREECGAACPVCGIDGAFSRRAAKLRE